MGSCKQAFAWWCFMREGSDADDLLSGAAQIGYQGVDLVPREHWKTVKKHGLVISSFNGHDAIHDGLNRPENRERIVKQLRNNILEAIHWHIPNLVCFAGDRYDIPASQAQDICAETLSEVAEMAESAGVNLALEMLNSKVDHPGYDGDHLDWVAGVVERVNSPRVRLLFDVYHTQIMDGDIIRAVERYHPLACHYHTAGNPGRNDLDDTQEIFYPPIMRAIAATGYSDFVCHEFIPKGEPVAALRAAYELCDV